MKNSDIKKTRINTTEFCRVYTEHEVNDLLIADLRRRAGETRGFAKGSVYFSTTDSISGGPRREASVKVVIDHDPPPVAEEAP